MFNVTAGNVTLQLTAIHGDNVYISPSTAVSTYIGYNNTVQIASTGAATFSSSVKVNGTPIATSGILSVVTSTSSIGATADLGLLITNDGTNGKMSQIGFGYSESKTGAVIGGIITSGAGSTSSALFFGTRDTTDGATAPTERMRITSAGNVGIGTTSPSAILHTLKSGTPISPVTDEVFIGQRSATGQNAVITVVSDGQSIIRLTNAANIELGKIQYDTASNFMRFDANSAERMRIRSNGVVSIGAVSGNSGLLDIKPGAATSDGATLSATYTGGGSYGPFIFQTSDTERMRITSGGNVGIGNTNPSGKLSVNDSIYGEYLRVATGVIGGNETSVFLAWNNAGNISLQQVTVGAADSGGSGFRLLRIPNT
jgi:hypothetical protein